MEEQNLGEVFQKLHDLSQLNIDEMTLQELFDIRHKAKRLQELELKFLDEMEELRENWNQTE